MHKWRQVQRRSDKLKDVYLMGFENGSFHCLVSQDLGAGKHR